MTLADLPPERLKKYQAIVSGACARWRRHPEFEELAGEAWLEVAKTLAHYDWPDGYEGETLVALAARCRVLQYLRSPANPHRNRNSVGKPVDPVRYLADIVDERGLEAWVGIEPDFAPGLIERLERRRIWEEFWATVPPSERDFVGAILSGSLTVAAAAAGMGRHLSTGQRRWQRALNRYRQRHELPLRQDNTRNHEEIDPASLILSPEDEWRRKGVEWKQHRGNGYVYRTLPSQRGKGIVFLHNEIATELWGPARRREVDFIDGNRLNLTRSNLRRQSRGRRWARSHQASAPQIERKRQWLSGWHQRNKEYRNERARQRYAEKKRTG